MSARDSVIAVYQTHLDADAAIKALQHGGVNMHELSVIGRGYHSEERVVGY